MKIKTLEKLQDTIDAEMGWRKRELTAIKYNIQEARKFAKDTALRAGVAMLYAHWEGAIKNIAYYYLSYVSGLKLPYSKLKPNFYAISLRSELDTFAKTSKASLVVILRVRTLYYYIQRRVRAHHCGCEAKPCEPR